MSQYVLVLKQKNKTFQFPCDTLKDFVLKVLRVKLHGMNGGSGHPAIMRKSKNHWFIKPYEDVLIPSPNMDMSNIV